MHSDDYLSLIRRYPCPEYFHSLRGLKRRFPKMIPDVPMLNGHKLFVDTTFTHVLPHLRYV
jgi:hypothetical protein